MREYAEGELGPDRSFFFRGPEGALNLRAHNLSIVVQMAAGVDDATWQHHLQAEHHSAWARDSIKDDEFAADFATVERDASLDPQTSRDRIKEAIDRHYTGPASHPLYRYRA